MEVFRPKNPDTAWVYSYLSPSLVQARGYAIDAPHNIAIKLDQNESPWDWPPALKQKVFDELAKVGWNRYPPAFPEELHYLVAKYASVDRKNVLLGPGSNHIISLVLSIFGTRAKGDVICARPSFPLYESHCQYAGISHRVWQLNHDLEYDIKDLQSIPENSLVIFASPNNPVGNSLSIDDFRILLKANPRTLFIGDEAYFEFSNQPYTPLLAEFSNLLLIRTFSKTLGAAGIRLGYLLGHEDYLNQVQKLMLPFIINHFSQMAATLALTDPEMKSFFAKTIENAKEQRQFVYENLHGLQFEKGFKVKPSDANFLLLRFSAQENCEAMYRKLIEHGILVRNVSRGPTLAGCLRVSIGTKEENAHLLEIFSK